MKDFHISNLAHTLKTHDCSVSLYGASSFGVLAIYALTKIKIKIDFIIDDDPVKNGKFFCGIPVIKPEELFFKSDKDNYIFIASNFIEPIYRKIKSLDIKNTFTCDSLFENSDFQDLTEFNKAHNYQDFTPLINIAEAKRKILTHKNASIEFMKKINNNQESLNIRMLDVVITEACTMKCINCSNLMPYYKKPKNDSVENILGSIDIVQKCVDLFYEVRILGGEPFLHKQIYQIINQIVKYDNIEKIAIFTNATIIPKNENLSCLKNKKVFLDITNYNGCDGDKQLSGNHDKLISILDEEKINYITHPPQVWTDSAKIEFRDLNKDDLKDMFSKCCVNDILTILNGNLYRCPFSANAINLNAIPKKDFIYLLDKNKSISEYKKELKNFYYKKSFIDACNFCQGRDYRTAIVEPAVQTRAPLEFQKYI
jgi:MoaA/NifB/PqqE/SkfB family radical SAM enzyme